MKYKIKDIIKSEIDSSIDIREERGELFEDQQELLAFIYKTIDNSERLSGEIDLDINEKPL